MAEALCECVPCQGPHRFLLSHLVLQGGRGSLGIGFVEQAALEPSSCLSLLRRAGLTAVHFHAQPLPALSTSVSFPLCVLGPMPHLGVC